MRASRGPGARASVEIPISLRVFRELAYGVGGRLAPAAQTELREDAGHVVLCGAWADVRRCAISALEQPAARRESTPVSLLVSVPWRLGQARPLAPSPRSTAPAASASPPAPRRSKLFN